MMRLDCGDGICQNLKNFNLKSLNSTVYKFYLQKKKNKNNGVRKSQIGY